MKETLEQLKPRFEQALATVLGAEYAGVDPILVPASNPKFGDYQANVALPLAKQVGKPPRAIAEQIVSKLDVSDICENPTVAGPGFINLTLKSVYLEAQLQKINPDPRLGIAPVKHPQKVIVDYPSPNIAKEMHVGHLRPAVIGDCISRILEFIGYDVVRLSHVGDWGTPFGMLIAYLQKAYPEALTTDENLDLGDLSSFYRQAKKQFDTDEEFKEAARQAVVQLQAGEEKTILAWKIVCQLSSRAYRVIYDLMGIASFIERGESFYNALLAETIEELEAKGLIEIDAGAKCVFLEGFSNKEGKPLPLIVQKSDGGYNYATTDLAAIRYRVNVDKAQRVIYPVGAEQTNHFAQIFQVGKRAGWITDEVEFFHAPFGLVLGEDGSKLKTRSGEAVRLKDLLDEAIAHARKDVESRLKEEGREETEEFINHVAQVIGISAVKYADLSQNRNSNYIFSYDKMLALQGNTAPYMLYAYARIQGISRKGGIDFEQLSDNIKVVLQHETEFVLAKHLLQLDEVISTIEEDLLPNRLCEYLFQLSQKFNQFYDRDRGVPVLNAEEPQRTSRLVLCNLTARTLKLGLSLLGIPVLERM
ncbi:arginine--tRNA ligase [Chroococcidiopsis sp. FACHB-1243]|uniref:arginine--tRNA ligase n=1 Tax=Chroococcidiopsis sp. [FACHB-1243] TaxID=2692781 RepID=UPI0017820F29|nr:arginine--tRNA ligase [Chroococcidiopsis sp. [FACHB-1243]]MBD2307909.1 arginine--tRNA ligase [Chroococcidiopsis sp. [FACHB-1243]]